MVIMVDHFRDGVNRPLCLRNGFAGIFDTFLGVSGHDRVLAAIRKCWASLFSTRAVTYPLRAGTGHQDMPMAVGVVGLIHARASGVAFSAHPVTGKTDRIVIETSWGWGEATEPLPTQWNPSAMAAKYVFGT